MAQDRPDTFDHHRGTQPLLRPTSRLRAGLFLAINLAGFAVVNAFWLYLARGHWVQFSLTSYRQAIGTPMGEVLVRPLNVLTHPWMIVVTGLLLGLVILVPLAVAVLYRLFFAAAFVVVLAAVGHAPVLAMALAIGCVLAARTPLRSDMPFLAVLVGLVPVALYLYLFGFAVGGTPAAMPLRKWVFYAPFILAGLAAAIGGAVVLLLARLTAFRPGVVWPVLAVLLAAPLTLFYTQVGSGELQYQLLVQDHCESPALFPEVQLSEWKRRHGAEGLSEAELWERLAGDDGHTSRRRRALQGACERFLRDHPDSERTAEVLWLRTQAISVQVQYSSFEAGLVRYSCEHARRQSAAAWEELRQRCPDAPQAALADWRLARLALRRGTAESVAEGTERLERAAARLRRHVASFEATDTSDRVFLPPEPLPAAGHYREALRDAEELLWLIRRNEILGDPDERYGEREALRAWLEANPNEPGYLGLLERIRDNTAGGTRLADNLELAVAKEMPGLARRAGALAEVAVRAEEADPSEPWRCDASVPAKYELGLIAMRPVDVSTVRKQWRESGAGLTLRPAEEYFREVAEAGQPWRRLAEQRLEMLADESRTAPAGGTRAEGARAAVGRRND